MKHLIYALDDRPVLTGSYGFPWFASAMLALESCEVVGLRLTKFATAGEGVEHEARLMISEKIGAALEAGASLMAGATPAFIVGRYRQHVAANVRRLSAA